MGIRQRGENNPNFGKAWSEEQKVKQGDIVKSKINDEYRIKAGSANRGKKFDDARIHKMHGQRDSSSYSRQHTDESKKKIGILSKAKFTEEYKAKVRATLVSLGKATPDSAKNDFHIYRANSDWIHKMWDLVEDTSLLKINGIFNSFTNKTGCERDHMYSRLNGFTEGVFPEILRHPANCQLLTHSDNSSKREKSSHTKEELFKSIKEYRKFWLEQERVLELISLYEAGDRFNANNYRRE